jgi:hypothetical protein
VIANMWSSHQTDNSAQVCIMKGFVLGQAQKFYVVVSYSGVQHHRLWPDHNKSFRYRTCAHTLPHTAADMSF